MTEPVLLFVNSPGFYKEAGLKVNFSPFLPASSVIPGEQGFISFQDPGPNGPSTIVTVTFDPGVRSVQITAVNPQQDGNIIIAYDPDGLEIARTGFAFDPTKQIKNVKTITAPDGFYIGSIKLVPPPKERIWYENLFVQPQSQTLSQDVQTQGALTIPVFITVFNKIDPAAINIPVLAQITPPIPHFDHTPFTTSASLSVQPIVLPLAQAFRDVVASITDGRIAKFFDVDRELKTVLNLGKDRQILLTNWMFDPKDPSKTTILTKLYQPLPDTVQEKDTLWISRELSPPQLDLVFVTNNPIPPAQLFLRSPNKNIQTAGTNGVSVENVTLSTLFPSGGINLSGSQVVVQNNVLQQFYTTALEGAELNIDYSNYSNFIFFSSAESRLLAFKNKLVQLEQFNSILSAQGRAASASLLNVTGSPQYALMVDTAQKAQDMIRSFDGYERFLYYGSASYSSSFGKAVTRDDQLYFHTTASWPKISGSVISVASASNGLLYGNTVLIPSPNDLSDTSWLGQQRYIAQQFDSQNHNSLINNIPDYLKIDDSSTDYMTFLAMIGHHFDLVKPYIDQMVQIYDRDSDPTKGLSPDLVWTIAQSLGIELPNQYALKDIVSFTVGSGSAASGSAYQNAVTETWKRWLHNQIWLAKSRGTLPGIQGLINTFGIRPELIQIQETATPTALNVTQSFEVQNELANALTYATASYVVMPWSSSGLAFQTIEVRFAATTFSESVILNADNKWALVIKPTGNSGVGSGSIQLRDSNNGTAVSSSFDTFYLGDYYSVMVRYGTPMTLSVRKYLGETLQYTFDGSASGSVSASWFTPQNLYLGGSGSFFATSSFRGTIDEFKGWGELLSSSIFDLHARNPGMYNGNSTGSASSSLYIRTAFNIPRNLGTASLSQQFVPNETPYIKFAANTASLLQFSASAFSNIPSFPYNYTTFTRTVQRFAPNVGGMQSVNNKIIIWPYSTGSRNVVADNGTSFTILSPNNSVIPLTTRQSYMTPTNRLGVYVSLTNTINDSILRSVGQVDLNNLIGDPASLASGSYAPLQSLNDLYWSKYSYSFNLNSFIGWVRNIMTGFFQQVENQVPVRSKLLTGLVIEPHILERARHPRKALDFTGKNTRADSNPLAPTKNLEALVISRTSPTASAAYNDYLLYLKPSGSNPLFASNLYQETQISTKVTQSVRTEWDYYEAALTKYASQSLSTEWDLVETRLVSNITSSRLGTEVEWIDDSTEFIKYQNYLLSYFGVSSPSQITGSNASVYSNLLTTFKPGTRIDLSQFYQSLVKFSASVFANDFVIPAIPPSTDPEAYIGAREYFMNPSGSVGTLEYVPQIVGSQQYTDRGTWARGTVYHKFDMVTQQGQGDPGDGKQFYSIRERVVAVSATGSVSVPFVSYIDPYLDTDNWRPVLITFVPQIVVQKATFFSGSVQIVPFQTAGSPFTGYDSKHYRFFRDNGTAAKRRAFVGCLQDGTTTTDGKDPIETSLSTDSTLIVLPHTLPVIRPNDESGPILDVEGNVT